MHGGGVMWRAAVGAQPGGGRHPPGGHPRRRRQPGGGLAAAAVAAHRPGRPAPAHHQRRRPPPGERADCCLLNVRAAVTAGAGAPRAFLWGRASPEHSCGGGRPQSIPAREQSCAGVPSSDSARSARGELSGRPPRRPGVDGLGATPQYSPEPADVGFIVQCRVGGPADGSANVLSAAEPISPAPGAPPPALAHNPPDNGQLVHGGVSGWRFRWHKDEL